MLGLDFHSGGFIGIGFKGTVLMKLANYSHNEDKLQSGINVGYIMMTPYSLQL